MPRVVRWLLKGLLALIVVVLVVVASGLAYRAWRQSQAAAALTISAPGGIDEATFLSVGHTRQWVPIRGQDRRKPVVLMVHGGPGAYQRGAGKTFGAAGRPDLFSAFVGALQELGVQRKWAAVYEGYASNAGLLFEWLLAPRTSLGDTRNFVSGLIQSQTHFFGPAMNRPFVTADLRRLGLEFDVPIFVIQGTEDDYTPAALSRAYVDALHAPTKAFVPMEGAGHFAIVSRPDEFLSAMKARLRQLTSHAPPARAREETFSSAVVSAVFLDVRVSPMTPK